MKRFVLPTVVCAALTFAGCVKEQSSQPTADVETPAASAAETVEVVFTDPTTVEISVPEMSCPFGCYPGVKEALEKQAHVVSVELGTPAEEEADEIKDRRVIVKTDGEFNVTEAVAAFPDHLKKGVEAQEVAASDAPEAEQPAAEASEDAAAGA